MFLYRRNGSDKQVYIISSKSGKIELQTNAQRATQMAAQLEARKAAKTEPQMVAQAWT